MITKAYNSFIYAYRGLKTTWREEHNFRIEIFATLIVVFCILFFKFSFVESALCIVAITMVLSAEIVNTVVEDLCDKVEPEYDDIIKKIKDTMAGFVLISILGAFVVGVIIFWNHFFVGV